MTERVLLVAINDHTPWFAERLEEAKALVKSASLEVAASFTATRETIDPAYYIGKGKLDSLKETCDLEKASVVIFNHELSPAQTRNLERFLSRRVIDRKELILDIFAQRAKSHEGKLQVELAQLEHLASRLVRGWTHLERQKGGIGLRGPGETQLETDRRLIKQRMRLLRERIRQLNRQRNTQRRGRLRTHLPQIAMVGYTNAGKSTLFSRLAKTRTYVADQLFATLDTATRKIWLAPQREAILTDTVGFIRDLPHELIAAFAATLEETSEAHLLLHVVDASSVSRFEEMEAVNQVLKEISAATIPQLIVFNKIDRLGLEQPLQNMLPSQAVFVSAQTGQGMDLLKMAICAKIEKFFSNLQKRCYDGPVWTE